MYDTLCILIPFYFLCSVEYLCVCVCVQVFQNAQELLQGYQVHPEIQAQMFAYLFFFSNVSLFNQLMDKGRVKSMHTHAFSSIRHPLGSVQLLVCVSVRVRGRECSGHHFDSD